jgi:hypothetical protein
MMTAALAPSESWLALPPVMVKPGPFAGLTAAMAFGGCIGTRALISRQRHLLVGYRAGRLVRDRHGGLDRREFVVESAALARGCRPTLALEAVFVLAFSRDVVPLGDDFGGIKHRHVGIALDHEQLRIDGVKGVHLVVLHQADGLAAAADRHFDTIEDHRARRQRDCLQAGRTLAIDRRSRRGHRQARAQQRLACDVAAGGALSSSRC